MIFCECLLKTLLENLAPIENRSFLQKDFKVDIPLHLPATFHENLPDCNSDFPFQTYTRKISGNCDLHLS